MFETEPNDLLPDDQVFDLIGDDFDEQLKDFDSGQKRKEVDPTRRFTQVPARANKQPRLSFRQKRLAQQTEAKKKQADAGAYPKESNKFRGFKEKYRQLASSGGNSVDLGFNTASNYNSNSAAERPPPQRFSDITGRRNSTQFQEPEQKPS